MTSTVLMKTTATACNPCCFKKPPYSITPMTEGRNKSGNQESNASAPDCSRLTRTMPVDKQMNNRNNPIILPGIGTWNFCWIHMPVS